MKTLTLEVFCNHDFIKRTVYVLACRNKDERTVFIPNGCDFSRISPLCDQCQKEAYDLALEHYSNLNPIDFFLK